MKRISKKNAVYLNSEALKMINYDKGKNVLEAMFTNGITYQYLDVPESIWADFLTVIYSGKSAGTFINTKIKPFFKYI
jgi:KTSC domain